ncbi:hypothetical protein M413DRAFT_424422, partial [Hebeloma cylindrosporum]
DLSRRVPPLVTGGGTGMSTYDCPRFASCGAKVYITGRRGGILKKAAAGHQGRGSIVALCMDVVDEESIKKGVTFISEVDGKLDILVTSKVQLASYRDYNNPKESPSEYFIRKLELLELARKFGGMALDLQAQRICAILCNFRIFGALREGCTVSCRRNVQCHQHL